MVVGELGCDTETGQQAVRCRGDGFESLAACSAEANAVTVHIVRCGLEDSIQLSDSPGLEPALDGFARDFHEPFFRDYMKDDLAALLAEAGFRVDSSEPHLVAKVVVATA